MQLTLTNSALAYLRSSLAAPGWAKGDKAIEHIYRGGQLLCDVLPEQDDQPELKPEAGPGGFSLVPADPKAFKDWGAKTHTIDMTDKLFEVCQVCLKHFAAEGRISPGKHTYELLRAFKLTAE